MNGNSNVNVDCCAKHVTLLAPSDNVPSPPLGSFLLADSKLRTAKPICFILLVHWARRAASRAACTAGNSSDTRMPMMVITTNNSTSVKPRRGQVCRLPVSTLTHLKSP